MSRFQNNSSVMPGCIGRAPPMPTARPGVPEPAIRWESAWPASTRIGSSGLGISVPIQFLPSPGSSGNGGSSGLSSSGDSMLSSKSMSPAWAGVASNRKPPKSRAMRPMGIRMGSPCCPFKSDLQRELSLNGRTQQGAIAVKIQRPTEFLLNSNQFIAVSPEPQGCGAEVLGRQQPQLKGFNALSFAAV